MNYVGHIGGEYSSNKFIKKKNFLKIYEKGTWTLSGRYSLEILLKNNSRLLSKNIYIPIFNCPSVHQVIKKYFKNIYFYDLDLNFNPKLKKIKKNSIILLVNYFGLQTIYNKSNLIIEDLSHCFLDKKKLENKNFYFMSLRKFGIFNYGGWSNVDLRENLIKKNIKLMEEYRKKKYVYLKSFKNNKKIEFNLLKELKIQEKKITTKKIIIQKKQISIITNKKFNAIKLIRKKNYDYLKRNIELNYLNIKLKKNNTPLFFFLKFHNKIQRDNFRQKLKLKKIFCPIFWKINKKQLNKFPNSKMFAENLLPIPIDHRIAQQELKYIINTINSL